MARAILVTLVAWRCLVSSCWSRKFQVPSAQIISLFMRFSLLRRSSRAIVQAGWITLCEERDLSQAHNGECDLPLIWDKRLAANRLSHCLNNLERNRVCALFYPGHSLRSQ